MGVGGGAGWVPRWEVSTLSHTDFYLPSKIIEALTRVYNFSFLLFGGLVNHTYMAINVGKYHIRYLRVQLNSCLTVE
jgi:hypothetical protein